MRDQLTSLLSSAQDLVGACFTRFASSRNRSDAAILSIAALVTAIAAGLTFRRAITPWSSLPDSDYWGNISGLITESGVRLDLANLFRHNNEHIVVLPKLIYAANYLATSGSNWVKAGVTALRC